MGYVGLTAFHFDCKEFWDHLVDSALDLCKVLVRDIFKVDTFDFGRKGGM